MASTRFSSLLSLLSFVSGTSPDARGRTTGLTLPEFAIALAKGFHAATGWVRFNNVAAPIGVLAPAADRDRSLPRDQQPPLALMGPSTPGAEQTSRRKADGTSETVWQWRSLVDTIGQEFGLERDDALAALEALTRFDPAKFTFTRREQPYGPNAVDAQGNPRTGSYSTGTFSVNGIASTRPLSPELLSRMLGDKVKA